MWCSGVRLKNPHTASLIYSPPTITQIARQDSFFSITCDDGDYMRLFLLIDNDVPQKWKDYTDQSLQYITSYSLNSTLSRTTICLPWVTWLHIAMQIKTLFSVSAQQLGDVAECYTLKVLLLLIKLGVFMHFDGIRVLAPVLQMIRLDAWWQSCKATWQNDMKLDISMCQSLWHNNRL